MGIRQSVPDPALGSLPLGMRTGLGVLFGMIGICSLATAQDIGSKSGWFITVAPNFGQDIIGSEDTRRGGWYGVGFYRPEKRLAIRGLKSQLHVEGYYMFTKGGGFENLPVDHMHSYGILATSRYWTKWIKGVNTYFDLGFGVAANNITTRDLESRINTTPTIGIGAGWQLKECDILIGVRLFHMSNGGTVGDNQGSNNIQYTLTVRF